MTSAIPTLEKRNEPQAAHRLHLSEKAFKTLILAIHHQSSRDLEICSPRRLLTTVLKMKENRLSDLDDRQLDRLCNHGAVTGRLVVSVRIDTSVNMVLKRFREDAEYRLGRPVSVAEAVYACCFVATLGRFP